VPHLGNPGMYCLFPIPCNHNCMKGHLVAVKGSPKPKQRCL
jgi:hypothetical protein